MAIANFPVDPYLTATSIAYRNTKLIADEVLPRSTVPTEIFSYTEHDLGERFTVPETFVGRRSKPNQVDFKSDSKEIRTYDYALDDPIPVNDVKNAGPNQDPVGKSIEALTDLLMLAREVRAAALFFTLNNYLSTQRIPLSGTSQFNDFVNSDPIGVIEDALEIPILRPNRMVMGRQVWSKFKRHPQLVKTFYPSSTDGKGMLTKAQVAELFELDEVFVGEGWLNTAKKGQSPNMARVWGKHISLTYHDPLASLDDKNRLTWGLTAQWGDRMAGNEYDRNGGGKDGAIVNRVGESVRELILASPLGYLIQNAVA